MNNFTPDTLRVGVPFPVGEQPDEQDWYDAHAAAWEADRPNRPGRKEGSGMSEQLPLLFYVAGSICFLVGSLISLMRSLT